MQKVIILFTLITCALLSINASAQEEETNSCRVGGTVIVFGNGINTNKFDAQISLAILEVKVRTSGIATPDEINSGYIFELSYNPTDGFAGDL
jgi:hypothetical protein